jgi:iron complex outermembrane receptor protein
MCRFKYGHLSVAMSIILLATQIAGAQTVGGDSLAQYRTLHLDAVSVTARPSGASATLGQVSQTRFLVDQKGKAPLGNPESVLRLLPSVDVRERGGRSTQADIAIRGGSFDQTMVMLNGIDFSDPRTGHQSHSLPVDLDILGDLVVMEGATRPGALAGAVDFRTAPVYARYLRARLEGGKWGYGYGNVSGAFRAGDVQTLGAVSYRRSEGYRHNTDFWNLNAYARVVWDSPGAGLLDIQGGFQRREWGSNGFYSLAYPDQFESTLTGLASVRWTRTWRRLTIEATGSFRRGDDRFEMVRDDPSAIAFNYHTVHSAGASLKADYFWGRAGVTGAGGDYSRGTMFSTAMGELLDNPRRKVPTLDGTLYPRRALRDAATAWAGHRKDWRRTWAAGQATLTHTPYGTAGTFTAEAGWRTGRVVTLRAGALRATRLPTFTELYYNVAIYHPNPNLKPETAMTYRATARAASLSGKWDGEASVWWRRTREVIDWEQRTGDRPGDVAGHWYSTQLNRLSTAGAELSARYTSGGWLRRASVSYGWLHSDMSVASDYISKYALDYMRHKLAAVVGVAFAEEFALTLTGAYYDRVGSWLGADGGLSRYRPYFLLDARLAWEPAAARRAGAELYLDGTNLTSTRYFDFGGLPMPGTWLSAGIVVTIR